MKKNMFDSCGWLTAWCIGLLLAVSLAASAENLTGKVVRVSDGDTFVLLIEGNKQVRVRLHGIDAPEMSGGQPYCRQSRQALADMIAGRTVSVKVHNYDRYKRAVGTVIDKKGVDVNLQMIKTGMAWHYSHFDDTPAYSRAEKEARNGRKGLWKDKNPVNPYQWRKRNRQKHETKSFNAPTPEK